MNSAAEEFGFSDKKKFIHWIISSSLTREQKDILVSYLSINETYFWRESRIFEALHEYILPELARSREKEERRLRIWSAGCATGEEPYSIAIALRRAIPSQEGWHITILATEVDNPTGYGRILMDNNQNVTGITEETDATDEQKEIKIINTGIYCFKQDILFDLLQKLLHFQFGTLHLD